eukprot:9286453-Lingulodinium_polyedra.AAC.1
MNSGPSWSPRKDGPTTGPPKTNPTSPLTSYPRWLTKGGPGGTPLGRLSPRPWAPRTSPSTASGSSRSRNPTALGNAVSSGTSLGQG